MLTSKQRADLRAQANDLDTTLMVGKGGVTENVLSEAARQLEARELVKGRVLEAARSAMRCAKRSVQTACSASARNS